MTTEALPLSAIAAVLSSNNALASANNALAERLLAALERQQAPPKIVRIYPDLGPRSRRIVDTLRESTMPLKGEAIAKRMHLAFSKSFQHYLGLLEKCHMICRADEGWVLHPDFAAAA